MPVTLEETPDDVSVQQMIKNCDCDWKKVKERYLSKKSDMQRLIAYRKKVVDGIIVDINKSLGDNLVAKAVGSTNLTSDYDITFASRNGNSDHLEALIAFNNKIKAMFGVPPGICFDTNVYAKDFLEVKDKTILGTEENPVTDGAAIDPVEFLEGMDRSDQDVGALTKQREYMDVGQWTKYRDSVIAAMQNGIIDTATITDPDRLAAATQANTLQTKAIEETQVQFAEAESTYALRAVEKIEKNQIRK
jgi:hypothetical protein